MRKSEAIDRADLMRPNAIPRPEKETWLDELEAEFQEMMGIEEREIEADDDPELLIPDPQAQVYIACLLPSIDWYQEETDLYQIDMIAANQKLAEVKAWWRRNNRQTKDIRFKGVWL